jgi:hypothetical protein
LTETFFAPGTRTPTASPQRSRSKSLQLSVRGQYSKSCQSTISEAMMPLRAKELPDSGAGIAT